MALSRSQHAHFAKLFGGAPSPLHISGLEAPNGSLEEYAAKSIEQARKLTELMEARGIAPPSFARDSSSSFPAGLEYKEIQDARMALIDAATALQHLAIGPEDWIKWQALTLKHDMFVLTVLGHYDVFSAVPADNEISYTDLAAKVGLSTDHIKRIIRHAMTNNIFAESRPGYVIHTATSIVPVKFPNIRSWIGHNGDDVANASVKVVDALRRWGHSQEPAQSGFGIAFGLDTTVDRDSVFSFVQQDGTGNKKGWRMKRIGEAMASMKGAGNYDVGHIHAGFDWKSLGKAKVVDLGGSVGHLSFEIARKHPQISCVVQDYAALEPQFRQLCPKELVGRVSFQGHDIFTLQPVKHADIYLFRFVFHDWPDAHCVQLLKSVLPVMKPTSRLLIVDGIVDEWKDVKYKAADRLVTALDLQVWAMMNAKERTEEDWVQLLKSASPKLYAKAFRKPEGSAAGFIEICLAN